MTRAVRKAVIPAAGMGTRFLPATKAVPKEMIPIVDRPGIQYVVEEAVGAGLGDVLVVTGRGKSTIEDHFDRSFELERRLAESGKDAPLGLVREVAELAQVHYVRQGEPRGLGHAVGMARDHVGDEPFAVLLPDDLMVGNVLASMIAVQAARGGTVLALKEVGPAEISAYGSARVEEVEPGVVRVLEVVEKPRPEEAPSNLAVMGRYVLSPGVFDRIEALVPGAGGELQLTDAIGALIDEEEVFGFLFDAGRFDTGTPLGFLTATVELGLRHPQLGGPFRDYLTGLAEREGLAAS